MAVSFGVTSTGGYGVLNSLNVRNSAETAECRDELGKVTDMTAYSVTKEASFESVYDGDDPDPGTSVTIGSVTGILTSSEVRESNTDYKRISGTVILKDSATVVGYSEGT